VAALLEDFRPLDGLGDPEHLVFDVVPEELRSPDRKNRHRKLCLLELAVYAGVLEPRPVRFQDTTKSAGRSEVGDPLVYRFVRDGRRVVRLGLDPELPELPLLSGNSISGISGSQKNGMCQSHTPRRSNCADTFSGVK
jgi:hypothetical protein